MRPIPPAGLAYFTALEDVFLCTNTLWGKDQAAPADEAQSDGREL